MTYRLKRFTAFFAVFLISVLSLASITPPKAEAADLNVDGLCVPRLNNSKDFYDGSVKVKVVNRAVVFVRVVPSGNCETPSGNSQAGWSGNLNWTAIDTYVSGSGFKLVDRNVDDDRFHYIHLEADADDDTDLDGFGDLAGHFDESVSGRDKIVNVGDQAFINAFGTPDLVFSIDKQLVGDLKCKDDDAGSGFVEGDNFQLASDEWVCTNAGPSGLDGIDVSIDDFETLNNINITYNVIDGGDAGIQVVHVSPERAGNRTFNECENIQGKIINGGGCDGDLAIDATAAELRAIASGVRDINICKLDDSNNLTNDCTLVRIAGPTSESAGVTPVGNTDVSDIIEGENPTCEATGFTLSWLTCGLFNAFADLSDALFSSFIQPLLRSPAVIIDPAQPIFQVWSSFRVIGNIILVFALLIIVFGQSIGGGLVDAYTAKKIAPRILAAAILINLSIYLVAIAVDITNVIGGALAQLIQSPFAAAGQNNLTFSGGTSALALTAFAAAAGLGVILFSSRGGVGKFASFVGLFVVLPAALIALSILFTLILRRGLLMFLIIVSPVAFALYCLPNTEQYFKKWWGLLTKTLLVYPIVVCIFAIADVLAVTIREANTTSGAASVVGEIGAFIAIMAPLVMIPFAFKLAGGAIGGFYGAVTGFGKKGVEAVKGNANDQNAIRNRVKRGLGESFTRGQDKFGEYAKTLDKNGSRSTRAKRFIARGGNFGNVQGRLAGYNKAAQQRREDVTSFGDDSDVYAGAGYAEQQADGSYMYRNSKGQEISEYAYKKGKSLYGNSQHAITQGLFYTLTKAQTNDDVAAVQRAFAMNAQTEGWTDHEVAGNWLGTSYPLKGQFAGVRYDAPYIDPADGQVKFAGLDEAAHAPGSVAATKAAGNRTGMLKDIHRTRQSFKLGEMRDQDWKALQQLQIKHEDTLLSGTASAAEVDNAKMELAQIYEVTDAATTKLQSAGGRVEEGELTGEGLSAQGTAAAQAVIKDTVGSRRFNMSTTDPANNTKQLVEKIPAGAAPLPPGVAGPPAPAPIVHGGIDTTNY